MAKFDPTEPYTQMLFVSMLQIWNLRYSRHFLIIKYIGLELILFVINIDVVSSLTFFIMWYYILYC